MYNVSLQVINLACINGMFNVHPVYGHTQFNLVIISQVGTTEKKLRMRTVTYVLYNITIINKTYISSNIAILYHCFSIFTVQIESIF